MSGGSDVREARWVARLFPEGVTAAEAHGRVPELCLSPAERRYVANAVEKRRAEFATGRSCARRALELLGVTAVSIPANQDRAPVWPAGAIGSISHSDGYCIAVAGPATQFAGLGVDVAAIGSVEPELWPAVFRREELEWLRHLAEQRRPERASVLFSAKEAFYKCQFALTGLRLEFTDVAVSSNDNEFCVTIDAAHQHAFMPYGRLAGKFAVSGPRVVCGMALRRAATVNRDPAGSGPG